MKLYVEKVICLWKGFILPAMAILELVEYFWPPSTQPMSHPSPKGIYSRVDPSIFLSAIKFNNFAIILRRIQLSVEAQLAMSDLESIFSSKEGTPENTDATSDSEASKSKARSAHTDGHITCLATETLQQIQSYISTNDSVCLGLTCKRLYRIHFERFGPVPLLPKQIRRAQSGMFMWGKDSTWCLALVGRLGEWYESRGLKVGNNMKLISLEE